MKTVAYFVGAMMQLKLLYVANSIHTIAYIDFTLVNLLLLIVQNKFNKLKGRNIKISPLNCDNVIIL